MFKAATLMGFSGFEHFIKRIVFLNCVCNLCVIIVVWLLLNDN